MDVSPGDNFPPCIIDFRYTFTRIPNRAVLYKTISVTLRLHPSHAEKTKLPGYKPGSLTFAIATIFVSIIIHCFITTWLLARNAESLCLSLARVVSVFSIRSFSERT